MIRIYEANETDWHGNGMCILQRLVGRDWRFDDPLLLQFFPAQVLRDRMHQRQAEVAACDL